MLAVRLDLPINEFYEEYGISWFTEIMTDVFEIDNADLKAA